MLINGTATLRCKDFLRQEIAHTLECYGHLPIPRIFEVTSMENLAYRLYAIEVAIADTLSQWCDQETCMHTLRLVNLAEAVGRQLQLSDHALIILRLSALLHDIGKVAIPAEILQKRGPLNDAERTLIRLHPQMGWVILEGTGELFDHVAPIIVAHHEAWDGSGYPFGLIGTAIPYLARILAVVDSYDAMVSYRVYGEPLPILSACLELIDCAGRQYDPQIVVAFLKVLIGERGIQLHSCFASRRNLAINGLEPVDEGCAKPLLQSVEYARELA
ncbi:HD-GYP domain-containing protein [Dictyobacter kobayashii]|uniref:HD-GYP domain-containing protein n=1 Tax=Dictyobacter kobayashii TaxID=2014872 RepID=A0A402AMM9_9CHLR|nr:HD domain-containing phosphohydrolase [Dictyobacter kobayashii]GCE20342.1 hypothetical protein KDK_41420 [Dictyobacter kobayashii]